MIDKVLKLANTKEVDNLYETDVVVCLLPSERELIKGFGQLIGLRVVELDEFHSWFKNLDTVFNIVRVPSASEFPRKYNKAILPPRLDCFPQFVERNVVLWKIYYERVLSEVKSTLPVSTSAASASIRDMLSDLGNQVGQVSENTNFSKVLNKFDALEVLWNIIAVKLTNRFARLEAQISFPSFDLTTLVFCLLAKTFTSRDLWNKQSINRIDNYILLYLLWFVRDVKINQIIAIDDLFSVASRGNRNLLSEYKDVIFTSSPLHLALKTFLVTTDNSGWNDVGPVKSIPAPAGHAKYLGRNELYIPLGGKHRMEEDIVLEEQFKRFKKVQMSISRTNVLRYGDDHPRRTTQAVLSVIRRINTNLPSLAKLTYYINRALDQYSLSSIMLPLTAKQLISEFSVKDASTEIHTVEVKPGSFYALMSLVEPESLKFDMPQIELVKWSWYVHEVVNKMTIYWYIFKEYLPKPFFTSKGIRKFVYETLRKVTVDMPDLVTNFIQKLEEDEELERTIFPDASTQDAIEQKVFEITFNFAKENRGPLGWTNFFYYLENNFPGLADKKVDPRFREQWLISNTLKTASVKKSGADVRGMLAQRQFPKFLKDHYLKSFNPSEAIAVRFNFRAPVRVELYYGFLKQGLGSLNPFNELKVGDKINLTVKPVIKYVSPSNDVVIDADKYEDTFSTPYPCYPSDNPFFDGDESIVLDMFSKIKVLNVGFNIIHKISVVSAVN
jgi:hypothetical protein